MYPAAVGYVAPRSLEEALSVLAEHGFDGKVIAGGQSLIPLLRLRFAAPDMLVDINRVPGLSDIEEAPGGLRVGALVRHNDVVRSALVRDGYPVMAAAAPVIADPVVRNLGTVGGSLAHADPEGDWATVMLALRADVTMRNRERERTVPMRDFLEGMFTTALEPDELLTHVTVPAPSGPSGGTYLKLERKVGDFATVGVAAHLALGKSGLLRRGARRIEQAGIALTAVGPSNMVATEAEELLAGSEPSRELFEEAAELAAQASEPHEDVRGSVAYKRHVVREFVRRGLERALEMARAR